MSMGTHSLPMPPVARAAVLFEVMLSVALFVGAAAFCLGATRSLFWAFERAERRQFASDLARSKLTELEAGLITVQDLRGEWDGGVGSHVEDADLEGAGRSRPWRIDIEMSLSEFRGLTLVELTVSEITFDEDDAAGFTLRQLLALRETEVEEYEPDDLLEGLPAPEETP